MRDIWRSTLGAVLLLGVLGGLCGVVEPAAATVAEPGRPAPSAVWTESESTASFGTWFEARLDLRDTKPTLYEPMCTEFFPCLVTVEPTTTDGPIFETSWTPSRGVIDVRFDNWDGAFPAGAHEIVATVTPQMVDPSSTLYPPFRSEPWRIEIEPIGLEVSATSAIDPANRRGVMIGGALRGPYLDRIVTVEGANPGIPSPAGTWTVSASVDGEVLFDEQTTVEENGANAVSWYWASPPSGAEAVVEVRFAPAGSAARNIVMAAGAESTVTTASASDDTTTVVPPSSSPAPDLAENDSGVEVPTWAVLVAGTTAAALLAIAIVLAIRLERRSGQKEQIDA